MDLRTSISLELTLPDWSLKSWYSLKEYWRKCLSEFRNISNNRPLLLFQAKNNRLTATTSIYAEVISEKIGMMSSHFDMLVKFHALTGVDSTSTERKVIWLQSDKEASFYVHTLSKNYLREYIRCKPAARFETLLWLETFLNGFFAPWCNHRNEAFPAPVSH